MTKSAVNFNKLNAGKSLRWLMEDNGLNNDDMSRALGVSSVTVSNLRRHSLMSGKNIEMLSNFFGVTCSEFVRIGES